MLSKRNYANGQRVYNLEGDRLTFFYKTGRVKAEGPYINGLMEGEWKFYRETGQLWQIGLFLNSRKNGRFVRYDRDGNVEFNRAFSNDKLLKEP